MCSHKYTNPPSYFCQQSGDLETLAYNTRVVLPNTRTAESHMESLM